MMRRTFWHVLRSEIRLVALWDMIWAEFFSSSFRLKFYSMAHVAEIYIKTSAYPLSLQALGRTPFFDQAFFLRL